MIPRSLLRLLVGLIGVVGLGTIVAAARGVPTTVPRERMQAVYEELKTPYKWGPVLNGPNGTRVDNPRVFRAKDTWYMTYNHVEGSGGYEGWLATSDDLVRWTLRGRILAKGSGGWDTGSVGVYLGLQSLDVDRAYLPETFEGRYWLSYIGGRKDGFEAYPLNIGLASTDDPARVDGWRRLPENPILAVDNPDVGWWENRVQFASQLVRDPARKLGYEFLLFYNAKGRRDNVERIGVAGSHDLRHWQRPLRDPIVAGDPDFRISGDPQLLQMGDLYVLLYFRGVPAQEEVGDHETFACSYDLVHWTPWTGTGLTRVREPWEGRSAAHKPWVFRWQGVVYHFFNYTHVIDKKPYGGIGLATSRFIGKSYQCEELEIDRADGGYVVVPGMKLAGYRGVEFRGRQAGDAIRFVVEVPEAGEYDLRLGLLAEGNGPRFRALLDDAPLGGVLQPASEPTMRTECGLGVAKLDRAGAHRLTLVLEDDALRSGGGYLVLDSIECRKR